MVVQMVYLRVADSVVAKVEKLAVESAVAMAVKLVVQKAALTVD